MRPILSSLAAIALSVAVVGCLNTVPETGRRQFLLTSPDQENQMGEQAYQQVLQKEHKSTDAEAQAMIERVGKRLAAVTGNTGFQWEFNLLESKEMNAFCLPGGKVAFYSGLLPVCQNEAAVATVMGHEIGHAIARHGGERMTQETVAQGAQQALAGYLQTRSLDPTVSKIALGAFGAGTQVGVLLPFSRKHESEADALGLEYMAKAGYDPEEAVKFWHRFAAATGGSSGGIQAYLNTHPQSADREQALREMLAKAKQWYASAPQKSGAGAQVPARYRSAQ